MENLLEKQKQDRRNYERYFINDDLILKIEEKEIVISNQWDKDNIELFIKNAERLGFNINKIEQ